MHFGVFAHSLHSFIPLTPWCITRKDAGGSLLLWEEDIATHFSYHFFHALPAATAHAGAFFPWVFCLGILVGLSSILNFTIQKCYLAQALKKYYFTPQRGNWSWWRRAVLPQLPKFKPRKNSDREESKQNKFLLVNNFFQSLILILTWILLVVRGKLLRNLLHMRRHLPQYFEAARSLKGMVICFYYCIYISIL